MMTAPVNPHDLSNSSTHLLQPHQNSHNLQTPRHQSRSPANSAEPNNHSVSTFQYQDANAQPDVDFNAYIRDDGNGGYHQGWQSSSNVLDQMQNNGFAQQPQASWDPHHQAVPGSLHSSTNGFISNDYVNSFSQASNAYPFPGYNGSQYQGYPGVSYNPHMSFGAGQYFNNSAFRNPDDQGFSAQEPQDQTISPSALQSHTEALPGQGQTENQLRGTHP